ncbi:MAG TPA: hypothetical protein VMZ53_22720 [Kofleriaceae bacterium]|nr:hypothetical protein [Kofleriaceae bacterium]
MELARGTVGEDRPWAITLATFARRGTSGQITLLADDGKRYSIALDRGMVVAARSPAIADTVGRIALTTRAASSDQINELVRRHGAQPHRDEIELLQELASLPPSKVARLRWEVTARRAARSFCAERGEFILEDRICLPVGGCEVDLRAVVYQGLRLHASEDRLRRELRALGEVFQLEPDAGTELHRFGFGDEEWPLLAALRTPITVPELEAVLRDLDSRAMQAALSALAVFGTARAIATGRTPTPPRAHASSSMTPSIASTSLTPAPPIVPPARSPLGRMSPAMGRAPTPLLNIPTSTRDLERISIGRTKTNPELAAEAAERATRALARDKPEAAVLELKKAVELVPNDVDYSALLGWALFCAADDKRAVEPIARKALQLAVNKSTKPAVARFFLGRIERMLGRDREALGHFHAVLMLQPDHRDAAAEIRVLQARLEGRR